MASKPRILSARVPEEKGEKVDKYVKKNKLLSISWWIERLIDKELSKDL